MSDERKQIALDGLSQMERSRLFDNLRTSYSAIANVNDSQQDVIALGYGLIDLLPIMEQVAADLYGYTPAVALRERAERAETRADSLERIVKVIGDSATKNPDNYGLDLRGWNVTAYDFDPMEDFDLLCSLITPAPEGEA
jgi:hypothetical protein